jgi:hypothetical protein
MGGEMEEMNISVNISVEKPIESDHASKYWYHISKGLKMRPLQYLFEQCMSDKKISEPDET